MVRNHSQHRNPFTKSESKRHQVNHAVPMQFLCGSYAVPMTFLWLWPRLSRTPIESASPCSPSDPCLNLKLHTNWHTSFAENLSLLILTASHYHHSMTHNQTALLMALWRWASGQGTAMCFSCSLILDHTLGVTIILILWYAAIHDANWHKQ